VRAFSSNDVQVRLTRRGIEVTAMRLRKGVTVTAALVSRSEASGRAGGLVLASASGTVRNHAAVQLVLPARQLAARHRSMSVRVAFIVDRHEVQVVDRALEPA
jgi:hypothetical protein